MNLVTRRQHETNQKDYKKRTRLMKARDSSSKRQNVLGFFRFVFFFSSREYLVLTRNTITKRSTYEYDDEDEDERVL